MRSEQPPAQPPAQPLAQPPAPNRRMRTNCLLCPGSARRRVRKAFSRTNPGSVHSLACRLCRSGSSRRIPVSSSSHSSRTSPAFARSTGANLFRSPWRSTLLAGMIRTSASSIRERVQTAVTGSRVMNGVRTVTTILATADSFSWPTTTGIISRARSCVPTCFACTSMTTSRGRWQSPVSPLRSPRLTQTEGTSARPLPSGRGERRIATHSKCGCQAPPCRPASRCV